MSFYGGALRSGTRASARPPPPGFSWPHPTIGLAFVHVEGSERRDGTSNTNAVEAERVAGIVRVLIAAGVPQADIGVLTPYASQVGRGSLQRHRIDASPVPFPPFPRQVRLLRQSLSGIRGSAAGGAGGGAPALEVGSVDNMQVG